MPSLSHSLESGFQNGGHETAFTDMQHYETWCHNSQRNQLRLLKYAT